MIHFLYLCILFQQFAGGKAHSGKIVKVGVYDGDGRSEVQVYVGTLEILADQRDDRLQSLVTSKVGGVVMGYLSGSYYTGSLTDKEDSLFVKLVTGLTRQLGQLGLVEFHSSPPHHLLNK